MPSRLSVEAVRQSFWSRVRKLSSGCWTWTGPTDGDGYGLLRKTKIHQATGCGRAHRVSWVLSKGPIPKGKCVLHTCDNPPCVKPSHLFLGTRGDNNRDRSRKGRSAVRPGPTPYFDSVQVRIILRLLQLMSRASVSELLKVHSETVYQISSGRYRCHPQ